MGRADETDDGREVDERRAAPVHRDVPEQAVLDLVPLARARREVTDRDGEPRAIRELLQLPLPQAQPRAVAATGVGGDDDRRGVAIDRPPHLLPPAPNRPRREGRRVVVDAHTDPAFIPMQIVDPVGNGLAARRARNDEVMHADALRRRAGAPGPAAVLERPDQFLLLGVHRDRRLSPSLGRAHLPRDVAKLRVPVGMLTAFARLDVALQAVAEAVQQFGDHRVADGVPKGLEGDRQGARAQAGPPQRRVRIAGRGWFDQCIQVPQQRGLVRRRPLAPRTGRAHPIARQGGTAVKFPQPPADRRRREPRRAGHYRDAAVSQRPSLRRRPQAPRPLGEHQMQGRMLRAERRDRHASPYHATAQSTSHFI